MDAHNTKTEKKPGKYFVEDSSSLKKRERQKREENRDSHRSEVETEVRRYVPTTSHKIGSPIIVSDKTSLVSRISWMDASSR